MLVQKGGGEVQGHSAGDCCSHGPLPAWPLSTPSLHTNMLTAAINNPVAPQPAADSNHVPVAQHAMSPAQAALAAPGLTHRCDSPTSP